MTYFYGGGNEIDIKSYIRTHITAQNVPSGRSPKSFHLRNDNGDVNLIGSAINIGNDAFTGFFVDFNTGDAYSFKKWGADPVIKKLGNDSPNTITVNLIKGNGAKSLEGMRPVVLTKQENGQYAIASAPTSFGVRNEHAEVDWGYNMGGAYIDQE